MAEAMSVAQEGLFRQSASTQQHLGGQRISWLPIYPNEIYRFFIKHAFPMAKPLTPSSLKVQPSNPLSNLPSLVG